MSKEIRKDLEIIGKIINGEVERLKNLTEDDEKEVVGFDFEENIESLDEFFEELDDLDFEMIGSNFDDKSANMKANESLEMFKSVESFDMHIPSIVFTMFGEKEEYSKLVVKTTIQEIIRYLVNNHFYDGEIIPVLKYSNIFEYMNDYRENVINSLDFGEEDSSITDEKIIKISTTLYENVAGFILEKVFDLPKKDSIIKDTLTEVQAKLFFSIALHNIYGW